MRNAGVFDDPAIHHSRRKDTSFKLIEAALSGEEVVIAKGTKPVVKLVPIPQGKFKIGLLEAQVSGPGPDVFAPMAEAERHLWEVN